MVRMKLYETDGTPLLTQQPTVQEEVTSLLGSINLSVTKKGFINLKKKDIQ